MRISDDEFIYRLNECKNKHELLGLFTNNAEGLTIDAFKGLGIPDSDSAVGFRAIQKMHTWNPTGARVLQSRNVASKELLDNIKSGKARLKVDVKKIKKDKMKMNKLDAALLCIKKMQDNKWGGVKDFKEHVTKHIEAKEIAFAKMVAAKSNG